MKFKRGDLVITRGSMSGQNGIIPALSIGIVLGPARWANGTDMSPEGTRNWTEIFACGICIKASPREIREL